MTLRLLIADNEPLARQRLRSLIEELGHEACVEVADAPGAEDALRRTQPDAALLDIKMPGPHGLMLAHVIESTFPSVPVVMVTAHAEHAVEAFEAGVRDYLLKPVRRERLEQALERVVGVRAKNEEVSRVLWVKIGRRERLVRLNEKDCFFTEEGYVLVRSATIEGFVAFHGDDVADTRGRIRGWPATGAPFLPRSKTIHRRYRDPLGQRPPITLPRRP